MRETVASRCLRVVSTIRKRLSTCSSGNWRECNTALGSRTSSRSCTTSTNRQQERCFGVYDASATSVETSFAKQSECCKGIDGYKCIHKLQKGSTVLEFENIKHEERVLFVIYADFECLTTAIEPPADGNVVASEPSGDESDEMIASAHRRLTVIVAANKKPLRGTTGRQCETVA